MSILIKGIDMPKAGELLQVAENVDGTIFVRETTHGEWHQVVPVPTPHGGLVDADELVRAITKLTGEYLEDGRTGEIVLLGTLRRSEVVQTIHDAPTVLEAEE